MMMLRAGMAVGMVVFGLAGALIGAVVLLSALRTGGISLSYGSGARALTQVLTYADEPARFLQFTALLGVGPLLAGLAAARWGLRAIRGS